MRTLRLKLIILFVQVHTAGLKQGWDLNPDLSDAKDFDPKAYKDLKYLILHCVLVDENKMSFKMQK